MKNIDLYCIFVKKVHEAYTLHGPFFVEDIEKTLFFFEQGEVHAAVCETALKPRQV